MNCLCNQLYTLYTVFTTAYTVTRDVVKIKARRGAIFGGPLWGGGGVAYYVGGDARAAGGARRIVRVGLARPAIRIRSARNEPITQHHTLLLPLPYRLARRSRPPEPTEIPHCLVARVVPSRLPTSRHRSLTVAGIVNQAVLSSTAPCASCPSPLPPSDRLVPGCLPP